MSSKRIATTDARITMDNTVHASKIGNIVINDELFGDYLRLVASKAIPYQWDILNDRLDVAEKSHCIENFKIAAGELEGQHQGVIFRDTDAYKWLEAVAYCIENGSGAAFVGIADELIDLIGRAQQTDGYLNTYYTIAHPEQRWTNLAEGHELYSAGHLIEAAVAYYSATGKPALLNIACRFADLICLVFGPEPNQCKGYPGHQEVEQALVKLYHVTQEKRYLDLAKHFIAERGKKPNYITAEMASRDSSDIFREFDHYEEQYAQTHMPPIEQTTAEGHAVRALYMYSAMADIAREYQDEALATACLRLWDNITKQRMYITGGIGSSGYLERFTVDYDLPNDNTYCETCASIGLMMFGQRMAALTGDASYYDAVERALCNTVLAGIAATGDSYFYVNPLEVWPANCKPSTSMGHVKSVRQHWFAVPCCPTNIARTLASLGQYIYSEDDNSLYINQFISSDIRTTIAGAERQVSMKSTTMQDGRVSITVAPSSSRPFTLRVRIPSYAKQPVFTHNDKTFAPAVKKGYAELVVAGTEQQTFIIRFDIQSAFVAANANVRANVGKVALTKGPYVYCLEETDNGSNLANFIIPEHAVITETVPLPGLPGKLPTLTYKGKRITATIVDSNALYDVSAYQSEDTPLIAVPYCLWCNRKPGEMLVWQKMALLT